MCNLSKGVMEKGMARGRAEGLASGMLAAIQSLIETMGLSVEQAMTALKVPEGERQKYRELLKNKF